MMRPEMTSAEFRHLQNTLGWSNTRLAVSLDVSPDTVSRWRFQKAALSGPVILAMKALASGWRP